MIEFKQSPNYNKGTGIKKIGFVLHGTLGSYKSAVDWLLTPSSKRPDKSQSSAHFVIGRNVGEVTQLVKIEDIAWHAGIVSNPSARAKTILPKDPKGTGFLNPNNYFVGIEFAWGYDTDADGDVDSADKTLTEWQYVCAMDIIESSGIYKGVNSLLSHKEITDYKGDDMIFAINEIVERFDNKKNPNVAIVARLKEIMAEANGLIAKLSL